MKAFRYIIFIPLIFILVSLLYSLLPWTLLELMSLSKSWLVVLIIFFGGMAVGLFAILPGFISWLSSKIAPNGEFAYYSILTMSVFIGICQIYLIWTNEELIDSGIGVFIAILLSFLTVGFATSLIIGGGYEKFNQEENSIGVTIGTISFFIGVFLVFCLLSTRICYIKPTKSYVWYSGIWHGLFAIPKWIVSWFSDDIYCKAPRGTTGYYVSWWITLIFAILSFIGGGNRNKRNY
jgi:hypothetical protein